MPQQVEKAYESAEPPLVTEELAYIDSLEKIPPEKAAQFQRYLTSLDPITGLIDLRKLDFSDIQLHKPRGRKASISSGTLREVIPVYLLQEIAATGGADGPIGRQFIARVQEQAKHDRGLDDTLEEERFKVAPGVTYKYRAHTDEKEGRFIPGRALLTFTYDCAAYCRFCTRGRAVGGEVHTMPIEEVKAGLDWIEDHPEVNEVILSGGDPLMMKPEVLSYVMDRLQALQRKGQLHIIRIGTRLPIHNPRGLSERHYTEVRKISNLQLMVHINHPHELTTESVTALNRFRAAEVDEETGGLTGGATLNSQTVLLRGVNDDVGVLRVLQYKLRHFGIVPYYIFQDDGPDWSRSTFTVPEEEAATLLSQVHGDTISGMLSARAVWDTPERKIYMPEGNILPETTHEYLQYAHATSENHR